ncbi:3D domain-containing protein [Microbulbifer salipaludis]|uniref:3D domain-containing protein n=1 Tax=Microbulbifer salipaludis TaxID=187980 RepID=A0ABS3EB27_9GAMM|nr:3D domain-containing protein [Microbulbifer salipaludis]MBN8432403.1 3D domain-containing protein [Microbulbifer salipaludis]
MRQSLKKYVIVLAASLSALAGGDAFAAIKKEPAKKKKSMTVTATAYNSVEGQTDDDPWTAAWNNRLRPGDKIIAVSRDLEKHGLTNGAKVKIEGLPGTYTVRDRMNKRYTKRIDVWMEEDIKKARKWGKKKLKIIWHHDKK